MSNVVAIHGIAQTFEGCGDSKQGWLAAMNDGLEEAGHSPLRDEDLSLVFYGSLFRKSETHRQYPSSRTARRKRGLQARLLTLFGGLPPSCHPESQTTFRC